MPEIKFLSQDDLKYVSQELKQRGYVDREPQLEMGVILFLDNQTGFCEFVVNDGKARYIVHSGLLRNIFLTENGKKAYPSIVKDVSEYTDSIFNIDLEKKIFKMLEEGYDRGILNYGDCLYYLRKIDEAKMGANNEYKLVKINERVGLMGAVLGFLIGAGVYKLSEKVGINLEGYLNFWHGLVASSCFGGFLDSTLSSLKIKSGAKSIKVTLEAGFNEISQEMASRIQNS